MNSGLVCFNVHFSRNGHLLRFMNLWNVACKWEEYEITFKSLLLMETICLQHFSNLIVNTKENSVQLCNWPLKALIHFSFIMNIMDL